MKVASCGVVHLAMLCLDQCSDLQKSKGCPVGCQANLWHPAVVSAQGMTDAVFLFLQLVAVLQRALGCPPHKAPIVIIEQRKNVFLLFTAIHGMA